MRIKFLIIVGLLVVSGTLYAGECYFGMGGYCVDTLLNKTMESIKNSSNEKAKALQKTIKKEEFGEKEGQIITETMILTGSYYYMHYDTLWNWLVKSGLAEEQDKTDAFAEAAGAGGTKIGGVNLVVLAARTLQTLVDAKIIELEKAQVILNGAKQVKNRLD